MAEIKKAVTQSIPLFVRQDCSFDRIALHFTIELSI